MASDKQLAHGMKQEFYSETQTFFCMKKEDFHAVHGLAMVGVNPRDILDRDIPKEVWLAVFKEIHCGKGAVKARLVRDELKEAVRTLHRAIYQEEKITNGELSIAFAKGLAAHFGGDKHDASRKPVAWALFVEEAMKMSSRRGELEKKKKRWLSAASLACDEQSWDCKTQQQTSSALAGPSTTIDMGLCLDDAHSVDMSLQILLSELMERMQLVQKQKLSAQGTFDTLQRTCYAAEGFSKAVQKLKLKVAGLEETLETTVDDSARLKILCQIDAHKEHMAELENDVGDENVQKLFSTTQEDLKSTEEALARVQGQVQFLTHVTNCGSFCVRITPPVPKAATSKRFWISKAAKCSACGKGFDSDDMVGVCMLPCGHPYHMYCFGTLCLFGDQCIEKGCNEHISEAVKNRISCRSMSQSVSGFKTPKRTCFSQNGSTGRRILSFDGIITPTSTPKQTRNTPEKDLEPTNVEMEQNKNESPPIVVEKDPLMKEVSETVNIRDEAEEDGDCTLESLAGKKMKKRKKTASVATSKGPSLQPKVDTRKSPRAGTVNIRDEAEEDGDCTLGSLAGKKMKKRKETASTTLSKGPSPQPKIGYTEES